MNHFEVFRNGKQRRRKLLTSKSLEEWRKHLAELACRARRNPGHEGRQVRDVKMATSCCSAASTTSTSGRPWRRWRLARHAVAAGFQRLIFLIGISICAPERDAGQQMEDKEETCAKR